MYVCTYKFLYIFSCMLVVSAHFLWSPMHPYSTYVHVPHTTCGYIDNNFVSRLSPSSYRYRHQATSLCTASSKRASERSYLLSHLRARDMASKNERERERKVKATFCVPISRWWRRKKKKGGREAGDVNNSIQFISPLISFEGGGGEAKVGVAAFLGSAEWVEEEEDGEVRWLVGWLVANGNFPSFQEESRDKAEKGGGGP